MSMENEKLWTLKKGIKNILLSSNFKVQESRVFLFFKFEAKQQRQEGLLRCQTPTSSVRLKVEGCRVKNGECRIKSKTDGVGLRVKNGGYKIKS